MPDPTWLTASVSDDRVLYNISLKTTGAISLCRDNDIPWFTFYCLDNDGNAHVRTFAPALGVTEGPVCGSGIAAGTCRVIKLPPTDIMRPGI